MKREQKIEFWQNMIDYMNDTWKVKKNAPAYPWSGREFRSLRGLARNYGVGGIMSLWEEYLRRENPYARMNGYSIPEFIRELPSLVDSPSWKVKARENEQKLLGETKQRSFSEFLA